MTPEDVNKDTNADQQQAKDSQSAAEQSRNNQTDSADATLDDAASTSESDLDIAENAQSERDAAGSAHVDQQRVDQQQSGEDPSDAAQADGHVDGDADDPLDFIDGVVIGEEDEVTVLQQKLEAAEAKVAEHWDQLLRMQADMQNQQRRAQNDVTKARKFALDGFANDLLPVKDSLEMGLAAASGDDADLVKIVEGSELTVKMFTQVLEKFNIVEINPIDEKFDPDFHQAMSMVPVEGTEPNTVTMVMQKGYTLSDRLIRPALVVVAK